MLCDSLNDADSLAEIDALTDADSELDTECDSENDFCYIKGDFEKWIDRLFVSQGSKYWRW